MRSGATATPAPRRSCPRIEAEGCWAGTSLRRKTTAGVASRGMVSSASMRRDYKWGTNGNGEKLLGAVGDEAPLEVVGGDADGHAVAGDHADAVLAHLPVEPGEHLVVLPALHLVVAARQHLGHDSLQLDQVFLAHPLSRLGPRGGPERAIMDVHARGCPPPPGRAASARPGPRPAPCAGRWRPRTRPSRTRRPRARRRGRSRPSPRPPPRS